MTVELVVQWTPRHGRSQKMVFERQPDSEHPWVRIDFELRESQWHEVGFEELKEASAVSEQILDTGRQTSPEHENNRCNE